MLGQNDLTAHLYQILARISIWGDVEPTETKEGHRVREAGSTTPHVWQRRHKGEKKEKNPEREEMLRVKYKLRANSSVILWHQKCPKGEGEPDRAWILELYTRGPEMCPYISLTMVRGHLKLCGPRSRIFISMWSLREGTGGEERRNE